MMNSENSITRFSGEYEFLSNMYPCQVTYGGATYPSVENAFQAAKVLDPDQRRIFETLDPKQAKKLGKKVELRIDWEKTKVVIMYDLLKSKFSDETLRSKLLETGDAELIEGNTWYDYFWGVCYGNGLNYLGKLLMQVRSELKDS
ncbi:MAG: NADAR family protein [Bacteroidaceae bacterium]|nr:NADAR family protein [Bacteroidaceae bacterium]